MGVAWQSNKIWRSAVISNMIFRFPCPVKHLNLKGNNCNVLQEPFYKVLAICNALCFSYSTKCNRSITSKRFQFLLLMQQAFPVSTHNFQYLRLLSWTHCWSLMFHKSIFFFSCLARSEMLIVRCFGFCFDNSCTTYFPTLSIFPIICKYFAIVKFSFQPCCFYCQEERNQIYRMNTNKIDMTIICFIFLYTWLAKILCIFQLVHSSASLVTYFTHPKQIKNSS